MNVYEISIWRSVYRNGTFSHTVQRMELVHALNKGKAKERITLAKAHVSGANPPYDEVSDEFIYSIRKTGTVTKQLYYEYSDGRPPRRVKGS